MNKTILVFNILLITIIAEAQVNTVFEFQPIRIYDTIKTQKEINSIKELDKVNNTFFFTTKLSENDVGLFLIEKKAKYWIVYDYNDFVSNYVVGKHINLNNQYVSIEVKASRSGYGINSYSWYLIFDLKKKSYLTLHKSSYNADENDNVLRECRSYIKFKNNIFIIRRTCLPKNDCGYCVESGIYKINDGRFLKIKSSH